MEITREQVEYLNGLDSKKEIKEQLNEWFGANELEVGKWYFIDRGQRFNDKQKALIFYDEKCLLFGFNHAGKYIDDYGNPKNDGYEITKATRQEIEEALIKEAIRKYTLGNIVKHLEKYHYVDCKMIIDNLEFKFYKKHEVYIKDSKGYNLKVFYKGKWAEIIETITKKEAEKQLGKKIID